MGEGVPCAPSVSSGNATTAGKSLPAASASYVARADSAPLICIHNAEAAIAGQNSALDDDRADEVFSDVSVDDAMTCSEDDSVAGDEADSIDDSADDVAFF